MKHLLVLALAATLLAACAGDARREGALSPGAAEKLASVSLDPASAGRILNAYRASNGLGAVRPDPRLMGMAQRQADAMAKSNSLSHDAAGAFGARVESAGLNGARAAENIGAGYFSTEEAFAGWRQSSAHNANLLMREATRYGIALAKDPRTSYGTWWALVVAADPEPRVTMGYGDSPRQPR